LMKQCEPPVEKRNPSSKLKEINLLLTSHFTSLDDATRKCLPTPLVMPLSLTTCEFFTSKFEREHSNGTTETNKEALSKYLNEVDENESRLTIHHLALFWRSCSFSKTVGDHYDEFDKDVAVEAAKKAFGIEDSKIITDLMDEMKENGFLKTDDNHRLYFTEEVWPKPYPRGMVSSLFYPPLECEIPSDLLSDRRAFLRLNPVEFARQLTLKEHELLRGTRVVDLSGSLPCRFNSFYVKFTGWVKNVIVAEKNDMAEEEKKDMKVIPWLFDVARECYKLQNYEGLNEIMSVLLFYKELLQGLPEEEFNELRSKSGCGEGVSRFYCTRYLPEIERVKNNPPFIPIFDSLVGMTRDVEASVKNTFFLAKNTFYLLKTLPALQEFLESLPCPQS